MVAPDVALARVTVVPEATAPAAGLAVGVATVVLLPLLPSLPVSHPASANPNASTTAKATLPDALNSVKRFILNLQVHNLCFTLKRYRLQAIQYSKHIVNS
jgi:hypothetical protein